ncbi:MAG: RNA methyltransferase [Flavobacteriaceae bacterium]|nr:RNA methyltransferase [Flavobacteriaceae bacterium]
MLSKSQIKLITSLRQKKFRLQHQLFFAEGIKTINELLNSKFKLHQLYTTTSDFDVSDVLQTKITPNELKKISALKTPNIALAVFEIPRDQNIDFNRLIVALDNVRDPGNLGTIIRLCDWFGVKDLICNTETVDCYNPKVIQASMGSITRVNVVYKDLVDVLAVNNVMSFGAFMDGDNIYNENQLKSGILVLGNEANGIQPNVEALVKKRISIPRFGNLQQTESLNVANATAILLSEFKRRY